MSDLFFAWLFHTVQLSVIATGVSLAARVAGFFSFVPLAGCLVSPFVTAAATNVLGNTEAALLCGIVAAAAIGWVGWHCLHRPLLDIPLTHLVISLGAYQIIQAIIALVAGDDLKTLVTIKIGRDGWSLIGAIEFLTFLWVWSFSGWGRIWRGCAVNRSLAEIVGIPVGRFVGGAFAVGSTMCALGSLAYASDTGYHTSFAFPIFLRGVTAAIVGGLGRPIGLAGGAASVAGVHILTSYFIAGHWADAATFLILIIFLIWKPLGFGERRLKKVEV